MSGSRVWRAEIPPEPGDVTRVRDADGDVWRLISSGDSGGHWALEPGRLRHCLWPEIVAEFGPLTEVID